MKQRPEEVANAISGENPDENENFVGIPNELTATMAAELLVVTAEGAARANSGIAKLHSRLQSQPVDRGPEILDAVSYAYEFACDHWEGLVVLLDVLDRKGHLDGLKRKSSNWRAIIDAVCHRDVDKEEE